MTLASSNLAATLPSADGRGPLVRHLYLHIPFCFERCDYCDFFTVRMREPRVAPLLAAMEREIASRARALRPETVYFGGGTPTALAAADLSRLLCSLRSAVDLSALREFTIEANPGTLDAGKAAVLREGGVNRVSLGAQTFDEALLKKMGRFHETRHTREAVSLLRGEGFENLNLDLLFGYPGQTPEGFARDLRETIALAPDHVSAYALSIEHDTPLSRAVRAGRAEPAPEESCREMYRLAMDLLPRAGLRQYEISSYARPGMEARHNLACWRGRDYLGIGPGAVSTVAGRRFRNVESIGGYLRRIEEGEDPGVEEEKLDAATLARERTLLGLRVVEGLSEEALGEMGVDLEPLAPLRRRGLLRLARGRLSLTRRGRYVADAVIREVWGALKA